MAQSSTSKSSGLASNSSKQPLPKLGPVDGYSYYITDDYFESNTDLSGRNGDTFKFNRPTFASCLEKRSEAKTCDTSIPWQDATGPLNPFPHSRHNIDDLLEELASESASESESESVDETLEQYYARIKSGISSDAQKLARNRSRSRSGSRSRSQSMDTMDQDQSTSTSPKKPKSAEEKCQQPTTKDEPPKSTADEIMQGTDESTPQPPKQPAENLTPQERKKQEEDAEFYELYHGSRFGLHDNLYDEQLDDEDEKYAEDHKLMKPKSSDAILSCGKCFAILTYDCQRHVKYENQFRAMFVQNENVKIVPDKIIKFRKKEVGRDGKRRRVTKRKPSGPGKADPTAQSSSKPAQAALAADEGTPTKPPTTTFSTTSKSPEAKTDDNANAMTDAASPPDPDAYDASLYDHYFQVVCGDCQNELAYYDRDQVYHFYNVIAS